MSGNWTFDEYKHCGVDYADIKEAEIYDEQHTKFRDYETGSDRFYPRSGTGQHAGSYID